MLVLLLISAVWCTLMWLLIVMFRLRQYTGPSRPSAAVLVLLAMWGGSTFRLLNQLDGLVGLDIVASHMPIIGFVQSVVMSVAGLAVLWEAVSSIKTLDVARQVARSVEQRLPDRAWIDAAGLTRRELEVLRAIVDGDVENERIGSRLGISPHTAATHVRNLMAKLDVHSRVDLTLLDSNILEHAGSVLAPKSHEFSGIPGEK